MQYTTLFAFARLHFTNAIVASSTGFILGAIVNYYLNYRYTFRSKKRHDEVRIKFFAVALIGLTVNAAVLSLAIKELHLHYLISQIIATGFVLFLNFAGNYIWTFREKNHE